MPVGSVSGAGALVHEPDVGQVPARVTEVKLSQVAEAGGDLEAGALDAGGSVASALAARLTRGEGQAEIIDTETLTSDRGAVEPARE